MLAAAGCQSNPDTRATAQTVSGSVNAPVVQLKNGALRGTVQDGAQVYLGVPYAKSPVGALRWQPPVPIDAWRGVRDAAQFGGRCAQNADLGLFAKAGGEEDCLNLNIYAPRNAKADDQKPVMIWIHGGSIWVGTNQDYNGARLAEKADSIVVTVNYRLGILGFFAHPEVEEPNLGLLDQRMAMQWVQDNIARFGGDPGNVTIFGESSGGTSVFSHLLSPMSENLFQQAIIMSGASLMKKYPAFGAGFPLQAARKKALDFAAHHQCGDLKCLQNLSQEEILASQTPYLVNNTIYGTPFMPEAPHERVEKGRINRAHILNGTVRHEGDFFVALSELAGGKATDKQDFLNYLDSTFTPAQSRRIAREYRVEQYGSYANAMSAIVTSSLFTCPALKFNQTAARHRPVYAYEFSDETAPNYLPEISFPLRAAHTLEIPYLFSGFKGGNDAANTALTAKQEQLAAQIMQVFGGFHRQNTAAQAFDTKQENFIEFSENGVQMQSGLGSRHNCGFWDKLGIY